LRQGKGEKRTLRMRGSKGRSFLKVLARSKTGKGAQIDLLIDRKDFAINICEMKYTEKEFTIDKAYANELENKRNVFKGATNTKKSLS